jgi:hypothetical protein
MAILYKEKNTQKNKYFGEGPLATLPYYLLIKSLPIGLYGQK